MMTLSDMRAILDYLITPLRNQIANSVARAVVNVVNNAPAMQQLQVTAEETIEDVEHFQPYGFSSVPGAGAESVIVCGGGDRAKAIAVVVTEQEARPGGQADGEVTVFHRDGARAEFKANGDIHVYPSGSGKLRLGSATTVERAARNKEIEDLFKAISLAATVAGDGGAAFKANILAGLPGGFPVGAQKVTIE